VARHDPEIADTGVPLELLGEQTRSVLDEYGVRGIQLGDESPALTIGNDPDTAGAMESLGAHHVACPVREMVVDEQRKLITTPAYMLAQNISEAAEGIENTVSTLIEMS